MFVLYTATAGDGAQGCQTARLVALSSGPRKLARTIKKLHRAPSMLAAFFFHHVRKAQRAEGRFKADD